ncbi:hypothetical protein HHS34_005220 [Acidithiobacillus montserratensis]|uniref:Uncharacterized protein n=1 Tax=Acidithiobacillus montserratensis TaxID=2729135 RepID=A0ACD5HIW4_9PROT|nr:hypothetical protein [Acidithiobacillus montserratensis]MBU2747822.1 hypothetical protein [Acidithiobacillus montserratensis]
MRIDDAITIIKGLPDDLQAELLATAQWLPVKAPLTYAHSKTLVLAWHELSTTSLHWSGANLMVRINPQPYLTNPELFAAPNIHYDAEIWSPFEAPWCLSLPHADLFKIAWYLKLYVATWGKTQVARRRHLRKDRLDGLAIGIHIQPADSTADVYLLGGRSLPDIIAKDIADQK